MTLDYIFDKCKENFSNSKVYQLILTDKKKVELNYGLMQLYSPNISYGSTKDIRESFENYSPAFNHTEFMAMLTKDGLTNFDWETMFQKFRSIISSTKKND